jgi:predicted phage tail protein
MIREVHLHGNLAAEFGEVFRLDIATCAEAVRALCQMVPGFRQKVEAGSYRVIRGTLDEGTANTAEELLYGLGEAVKQIHIIPAAIGGKNDEGIGKVLLGAVLVGLAFVIPGSTMIFGESMAAMVGKAGVAIALGGVAQILVGQNGNESQEQETSDLFSGSPNQAVPGSAIPVIFGEMEVPVKIISAAVHLEDRISIAEEPSE